MKPALAAVVAFAGAAAVAQPAAENGAPLPTVVSTTPVGSAAFCLYALPLENGNPRWINLGIVQFVEAHPDFLLLNYGGGNFGSGHEARIPVKSRDEANALVVKLRQTAEDCARRPIPNLILKEEKK